jgi:hypothetical protein
MFQLGFADSKQITNDVTSQAENPAQRCLPHMRIIALGLALSDVVTYSPSNLSASYLTVPEPL